MNVTTVRISAETRDRLHAVLGAHTIDESARIVLAAWDALPQPIRDTVTLCVVTDQDVPAIPLDGMREMTEGVAR